MLLDGSCRKAAFIQSELGMGLKIGGRREARGFHSASYTFHARLKPASVFPARIRHTHAPRSCQAPSRTTDRPIAEIARYAGFLTNCISPVSSAGQSASPPVSMAASARPDRTRAGTSRCSPDQFQCQRRYVVLFGGGGTPAVVLLTGSIIRFDREKTEWPVLVTDWSSRLCCKSHRHPSGREFGPSGGPLPDRGEHLIKPIKQAELGVLIGADRDPRANEIPVATSVRCARSGSGTCSGADSCGSMELPTAVADLANLPPPQRQRLTVGGDRLPAHRACVLDRTALVPALSRTVEMHPVRPDELHILEHSMIRP